MYMESKVVSKQHTYDIAFLLAVSDTLKYYLYDCVSERVYIVDLESREAAPAAAVCYRQVLSG